MVNTAALSTITSGLSLYVQKGMGKRLVVGVNRGFWRNPEPSGCTKPRLTC
jgi:hypothetical protein